MAINLQKGQKNVPQLSKLTIGLGWNPNEGSGAPYDIDLSAFMLNSSRMLTDEKQFIFYGNPDSPDGSLHHSGDDATGSARNRGDDEAITIDLAKTDESVAEILLVATINDAANRKQAFGQMANSYVRIFDENTNTELAKFNLSEDFMTDTALEVGRLYKRDGNWHFEASGVGHNQELPFFIGKYFSGSIVS